MDNSDNLIAVLAAELGISREAVRKWRARGAVPPQHRDPLREAAARYGKAISREQFDSFGRDRAAA